MGIARDHEDSDERHGYVPKLILAGRLTGTLDGRPVVIEAGASGLLVRFSDFRTAWAARKSTDALLPAFGWLRKHGVPLHLRIAGWLTLALLPDTSAVAKIMVPGLGRVRQSRADKEC